MEMKIIDEQLEDKQQIVTYKYLVEKLNTHPNKAKKLLNDYVAQNTNKKYSITIVIGGTLQENNEFCIVLAHDDHVETVRRRFKHISFEHPYSIQPISRFDDINNALYLVDNSLNVNVNLPSSIKRKQNTAPVIEEFTMVIDANSTKETKSILNEVSDHSNNESKSDQTQEKETNLKVFQKTDEKKIKKHKVTEIKVSPKKNNSDFFSKFKKSNNSPKNSDTIKKDDSINDFSLDKSTIKKDRKLMDVKSPKSNAQENSPNKTQTKNQNKSTEKKENGKKIKKKSNQKVKRKRIQTFNSSEEEIDSEEEDKKRSELVLDVDDEVDLVQPTPPRPTQREYRKMEKKTTTSTFIDDDGFVCTAKEVQIVETESEPSESFGNLENSLPNEFNIEPAVKKVKPNEPVPEKKKGKNKQSKNSTSQGMKQSSLTSFFKTK